MGLGLFSDYLGRFGASVYNNVINNNVFIGFDKIRIKFTVLYNNNNNNNNNSNNNNNNNSNNLHTVRGLSTLCRKSGFSPGSLVSSNNFHCFARATRGGRM